MMMMIPATMVIMISNLTDDADTDDDEDKDDDNLNFSEKLSFWGLGGL